MQEDRMNKNVVVKETRDKGKGVFALRDFKRDEFILHIDGEVVETDNPSSLSKEFLGHNRWQYNRDQDCRGEKYKTADTL